ALPILYLKILGRAPDPGGRSGLVNFLQHGGTVEQAAAVLASSQEFNMLTGSDGGFVQGLYVRLLGRIGSNGEVATWIAALPNLGRMGVAGAILNSAEFRADVVQQLYGFTPAAFSSVASLFPSLLHR